MPYFADRVKETTTSTGTGSITLAGAATGFRTFAAGFGASATPVGYVIVDNTTGAWEIGRGLFDGTATLVRDAVYSSSNSGALVAFAAGSKDVFCSPHSDILDNANTGFQYAHARGMSMM